MYLEENRVLKGVFTHLPIEDVYYGDGAIESLGDAMDQFGMKRALMITGTTLATKTNLVDLVKHHSGGRICGVFYETVQHVHRGSVLRAMDMAKSLGADSIISFGGGTPNDTGKAVVAGLSAEIKTEDDFDQYRVDFKYPSTTRIPDIPGLPVPMIAISTTLSAGEFTHFAGITDSNRRVKDLYINKKLSAKAVFLDPALAEATPDWLWLSTGIRAVDHCVEALCSTTAHPFTDAMAAQSLAMLNNNLRKIMRDKENRSVRTNCHLASWLSVCGLANVTLGMSHGIGHQLGARNNVPHGLTSCVMMGPTMDFNQEYVGERQSLIAKIMGIETKGMTREESSSAGRKSIRNLISDLGLPSRLRDVNVEPEDFPFLAKDALEDLVVATNPRPVGSVEDVIDLLQSAW
tara:strand:- start:5483 stop:6697 length:1215 start_codon:yes stop_codon:yes gene_type:complete